jgi:hypothetical protein
LLGVVEKMKSERDERRKMKGRKGAQGVIEKKRTNRMMILHFNLNY